MFRNPRQNSTLPSTSKATPSVGRPPSPSLHHHRPPPASPPTAPMAAKNATKKPNAVKSVSTPAKVRQTTLTPRSGGAAKKAGFNGASGGKGKVKPNGNIMAFFKKAEEINTRLFVEERGGRRSEDEDEEDEVDVGWGDGEEEEMKAEEDEKIERYNENGGSIKRRKFGEDWGCTPPPPDIVEDDKVVKVSGDGDEKPRRVGPFIQESDSEDEDIDMIKRMASRRAIEKGPSGGSRSNSELDAEESKMDDSERFPKPVLLKTESTDYTAGGDFEEFQDFEDEDLPEGEEYDERRWIDEQRRLEEMADGFEGEASLDEGTSIFDQVSEGVEDGMIVEDSDGPSCPLCSTSLAGLSDQDASIHVNSCLDGTSTPILPRKALENPEGVDKSKRFKRPERPPKPGQENPFKISTTGAPNSAFSKLMSSHAEDAAWAAAAAADSAARGKPAYQRTCPFYKILPGMFICVDAFRYGAVKDCQAYFLSHFHSDHYIGLTASWNHGPIYCSRVTANLVRQQLRVDPKWIVDLEFEKKTEVPGTQGVQVTMIPANHCPGSSLFLFEKVVGKGTNPKMQRVLHCGDFRACRAHVEHPLLRPDVLDAVGGKTGQQKLDVCYLDTTYLNPKYAFPPQEDVIKACADMCVSMSKERTDDTDGWEKMKRERAGEGMAKFVRKDSDIKTEDSQDEDLDLTKAMKFQKAKTRGRLLVIVGTYSIGKERICVGIAKALKSKIYAPAAKLRICEALEDPELNALLTKSPHEAQVHMTPLFEIRAETLEDYLGGYREHFSRAVGFRPSGWNYRPPNSRFVESPSVQTVLHSKNWKSTYSMKELVPQRGSTNRASCFGVPYSEHSSFRELTAFCCALRIDKIIPTVNIGNAKTREKMKGWCERWAVEKRKNGLYKLESGEGSL
ncbi:DRMBL-domain-containing protein [Mytilinidion resinicola]|uniref:DRMBL-domain-containing protein n=1 Tax=Mytilinidion resinicola TaxID=574789 RepID=A0A6A6YDR4_9PEZI|nr:DRMBL-domain-containing protein [Mytilinidion resinicola]KAF2806698.1 DRMBL-domain-containing protein [Mytilinidion resinicola]